MKKTLLLLSILALCSWEVKAQCGSGEVEVLVNVTLDQYGSEISWTLTGPGGTPVLASGGPYTDAAAAGAYPVAPVSVCAALGTQVIFNANDGYGDGWCCSYGDGGFSVVVDGNEVASGGSFGASQSKSVFMGSDLAITSLSMEPVVHMGNTNITGVVANTGITPLSSFDLTYTIANGTPVTETITTNLVPGTSYAFTHPTPWDASVGTYDLDVAISGVPEDGVSTNNDVASNIGVSAERTDRVALIEQFTSSTCPPCAQLNIQFGPILEDLNTNAPGNNVAAVKYHMNWPAPGNDPSYNPDGNTRKSYYGVTGIPDLFIDGKPMQSIAPEYITGEAARDAFVNLDLDYWTSGNMISVTADVTPLYAYTGAYKLHIALLENSYDYPASTTTQDEFHFVQRKMLPNGQGNTLTSFEVGTTQTVNKTYTMNLSNPAQGNYNMWDGGMEDLTVVAFVQNTSTKDIVQAALLPVISNVTENVMDQHLRAYPNPTNGLLNVQFEAAGTGNAQIEVINVLGERVLGSTRAVSSGIQRETLDMSGLSNGIYFVNISANGMRASRKVTLNK